MAVTTGANILRATADGDIFPGPVRTAKINVLAGAGGITILLRKLTSSGKILFEATLAADATQNFDYPIISPGASVYVQITAGGGSITLASK